MFAIDIVGQEHGLDLFGFVVVIEELAKTSGEEGNQPRHFVARDAAEFLADAKKIGPAAHGSRIKFGRRLHEEGLQVTRQFFELVIHFDESFRVLGGNFFELRFSAFAIGPLSGTTWPSGKGT